MPLLIQYLLKLSISLSLVYLFYQLLLRRLTFYHWNRWYLLGYSLLSFVIPFVNITPWVNYKNLDEVKIINYIPVIENYTVGSAANPLPLPAHTITIWDIVVMVLLLGVIAMIIRLLVQYLSLQKIKRNAVVVNEGKPAIYHVEENIIPFSFGNSIYINQNLHSEKEFSEIILHEYVHVRQKHTVDILLAELFCMINWYNPFAWLIRHAIRQNLEFIADHDVLQSGLDKKAYQYHLLKVVGLPQYRIANSFNFSSLKKRIVMMNKFKSARINLIKFLFVLPLLAVLLLAFRDKYGHVFKKANSFCSNAGIVIDGLTNKPLKAVIVEEVNSGLTTTTDEKGFYMLKIPLAKDSLKLSFKLKKDGYQEGDYGYIYPENHEGLTTVLGMFDTATMQGHKVVMFMPGGKTFNSIPAAEDVLKLYDNVVKQNSQVNAYVDFIDSHPEVSLFYSTEDKTQHIVFLKNGDIEKYGYAGSATIADFEKKYSVVPEYMKPNSPDLHANYHARWRKISEAAEKVFKTTNTDARAIIFPGDSRVIAVPKNGKPELYDMDNADPKERPAFEKLYGPLPDVVPPAANNTSLKKEAASNPAFIPIKKDSVPGNSGSKSTANSGISIYADSFSITSPEMVSPDSALYVIDGTEIPKGISWAKLINASFVRSMTVLKDVSATSKYGDKGRSGVIEITTKDKNFQLQELPISEGDFPIKFKGVKNPLFFIDGKEASFAEVQKLKASEIGTVTMSPMVDMPNGATVEKGKDGIIYIGTKKLSPFMHVFTPATLSLNAGRPNSNPVDVLPEFKLHSEPLYILDGKEEKPTEFKQLNPNDIEFIGVLTGETATKQYGEKGKNGVLVIKTKKKQSASAQPLNRSAANNNFLAESNFHTAGKFPDLTLKNRSLQDTLIIIADKIVYKGRSLQFSGSVKTVNQEISNADVTINIESNTKLPLIYFNGTEVQRIKNFKTHPGQYRLVSLHRQDAIEKYGDKGRNGAIEIASL